MRVLAALTLVALAGSCGTPTRTPSLSCFPKDAQKWIYRVGTTPGADAQLSKQVSAKTATLYFDRSTSMVGYLDGANNDNRPLEILINNLPNIVSRAGANARYSAFGAQIEQLGARGSANLLDKSFYRECKDGVGQSCNANLRNLFEQIEQQPDELATVVTDLWHEEGGAEKEGSVRLQAALTNILADGRSVAIYGINAPFKGFIYGIPVGGNDTDKVWHEGTHPLFLIVIGRKGDVIEFDRQLQNTVGLFQEGLAQGRIQRSIFMVDPGPLRPVRKDSIKLGNELGVRSAMFETYPQSKEGPALVLQQFRLGLSRGGGREPPKPSFGRIQPAVWIAPHEDDFLPNTVHAGPLKANIRLWSRSRDGDKCSPWRESGHFVEEKPVGDGVTSEGQFRFELSEKVLRNRILRPGIYLISGQLERISVNRDNVANRWAAPWSVSADGAGRFAATPERPGGFFPTLNLRQVMSIMENALQTATERKGGGIVGFAVLVKAEK